MTKNQGKLVGASLTPNRFPTAALTCFQSSRCARAWGHSQSLFLGFHLFLVCGTGRLPKTLVRAEFIQVCTSNTNRPKPTAVFANLLTSWIAGIFEVDQIVVRLITLATRIHLFLILLLQTRFKLSSKSTSTTLNLQCWC